MILGLKGRATTSVTFSSHKHEQVFIQFIELLEFASSTFHRQPIYKLLLFIFYVDDHFTFLLTAKALFLCKKYNCCCLSSFTALAFLKWMIIVYNFNPLKYFKTLLCFTLRNFKAKFTVITSHHAILPLFT